ncbi:MAG TPA: SBBP repeat-containing protein [Ramlibacter sp.]|uniref:DUF7948 domain-containing protein n=1 Tax=Ramlibacter sp. TaxID=1917967 RepID=UPI002ED06F0D
MISIQNTRHWLALSAAVVLALLLPPIAAAGNDAQRAQVLDAYGKLPLTFVENQGQADSRVQFYARGARHALFFTRQEIVLSLAQEGSLALRFVGANPQAAVEGEEPAAAQTHYFRGNDPAQWKTGLRGYAQVVYRDLWPGVDLALRGRAGQLKYEFRVRPGARPADIRLAYAGAEALALDDAGGLKVRSAFGTLRDAAPVAWQDIAGVRVPVRSGYALKDGGGTEYGFAVGAEYQPEYALVIDPALEYSTFLGGSADEFGNGIAVDAAGNAYIVGTTQSLDFPTTAGVFDRTPGNTINTPDAFVVKLNASGTALVYSTFLAGSGADFGRAIAIDAQGNAYVTGKTQSSNFPTTGGAFDRTPNIPQTPRPQTIDDGFVAKLNPTGSALVYSTYLGGTDNDEMRAIAVDASGNAYVTGETASVDYPTTAGAFDRTQNGENDVFVTKLNATGTALVYSTYLGGTVSEIANAIAVNPANEAFVVGSTRSANFPTTPGAFDTTHNGNFDAYVTRLNAAGSALVYSTFLGGSDWDDGNAIALDAAGNAYVAGGASSPEFPTTAGAFRTVLSPGASDGFVAKLNPAGTGLVWSTFVPRAGITDIALDAAGNVWLTGVTSAADFPVTQDAFDTSFNGVSDAFLAGLNANGTALIYATFLGGTASEIGFSIAVDANGKIYLTGTTRSSDFPTTPGALDRTFSGNELIFWGDAFVARFSGVAGPPAGATLSALAISPPSVQGGAPATGTVSLNAPAPAGGSVVALSDDSAATTVPASVTIAAGGTSASFAVGTTAVTATTTATISAMLAGVTRSATLTVTPAGTGTQFTLAVTATGRGGERVTSSPAGINVAVGSTGSASFAANTAITLSVSNGRDAIWSGSCSSGGNKTRTCTFTLTGNASVAANVQ